MAAIASAAIPSPITTSPIFVVARSSVAEGPGPAAMSFSTVSTTAGSSATPLIRMAGA